MLLPSAVLAQNRGGDWAPPPYLGVMNPWMNVPIMMVGGVMGGPGRGIATIRPGGMVGLGGMVVIGGGRGGGRGGG